MSETEQAPEVTLDDLAAADAAARRRFEQAKRDAGIVNEIPTNLASIVRLSEARPISVEGQRILAERAAEDERRWRLRAEWLAKARREAAATSALPEAFRWASFTCPELATRVKSRTAMAIAATLSATDRAVFTGASGTGKTSLAAAGSRLAVMRAPDACSLYFESSFSLAIARSRHALGEGEPEAVARALSCDLLVLDELGSDEIVHASAIKEIVFQRHWRARATWITTWMSPERVSSKYGDGVARRIFDGATVVDCGAT